MSTEDYASLIKSIWDSNKKNVEDCAKQSVEAYPLPPIMRNLEIMSNNQFSKLLADTQKRSFYLGALAMAHTLEEASRKAKQ